VGGHRHAPPRPLYPRETYPVPPVQEAEWTSKPIWTGAEDFAPPGFNPRTVQPVASRHTNYTPIFLRSSKGQSSSQPSCIIVWETSATVKSHCLRQCNATQTRPCIHTRTRFLRRHARVFCSTCTYTNEKEKMNRAMHACPSFRCARRQWQEAWDYNYWCISEQNFGTETYCKAVGWLAAGIGVTYYNKPCSCGLWECEMDGLSSKPTLHTSSGQL
jgi:hypothetical protein